ncbi:FecR domain-containing protein [Pedobacter sp. MC2016-14]|uniref:FecR family protein n=1 Tax=Pedobacter sp. MC2016-14 TaxID=2897327 RepID=UPI001E35A56B|nr:FecR family protein [Pedobacter sp. MC2016-14]MCD0488085.1 FecR domain-containing protein [Pedobacter sp. MC2016-14]
MVNWEDKSIVDLYFKFSTKTASVVELEDFNAFLNTVGAEQRLFDLLETDYQLSESNRKEISDLRSQQIFEKVVSYPQANHQPRKLWPRLAGVAAIAAILVFSILVKNGFFHGDANFISSISAAQDIAPGKNGATLTLASGRKIVLSEAHNGALASESGVRISKTADGEITYEILSSPETEDAGMNTLSTHRGETYRVKLPDGSLVWLNAASSITYPASFAKSKSREVVLDGEAYFEIEKEENHPFIVKSDDQDVTVLGTHFNVKAYKEETDVITTLLEGSVRVDFQAAAWGDKGKVKYTDEIRLSPGQQSSLRGESMRISKANLEESIAWKDGDFVFTENGIERMMRDIARWYNVEVIYEGSIPTGAFSGNVSRSKNISQVLQALEATKLVHFKLQGRRVYVTK